MRVTQNEEIGSIEFDSTYDLPARGGGFYTTHLVTAEMSIDAGRTFTNYGSTLVGIDARGIFSLSGSGTYDGSNLRIRKNSSMIFSDHVQANVGRFDFTINQGTGTIIVRDNADVSATYVTAFDSRGLVRLEGGTLTLDSFDIDEAHFSSDSITLNHYDGELIVNGGIFNPGDSLTGSATDYHIQGSSAANHAIVTLQNGTQWNAPGQITVARGKDGTLNIESGAEVTTVGSFRLGRFLNATGTLNIDGTGSTLDIGTSFLAGQNEAGVANITDGGTMVVGGDVILGDNSTGNGVLMINGSASTLSVADDFFVGGEGQGTLNLSGGTINLTDQLNLAANAGSTGTVHQTGGALNASNMLFGGGTGTYNLSGGQLNIAGIPMINSSGTMNVDGGTFTMDGLDNSAGGTLNHYSGEVKVDGGSYAPGSNHTGTASDYYITGDSSGDHPMVTLQNGAAWDVATLSIGHTTQGTLNIESGSSVTTSVDIFLGSNPLGTGHLNVGGTDSSLSIERNLLVGEDGAGQFHLSSGGTVDALRLYAGMKATSESFGVIQQSGGTVNVDDVFLGWRGEGDYFLNGGTLNVTDDLFLGRNATGDGSLSIAGSNTVLNITDQISLGNLAGSIGNIMHSNGSVSAARVFLGNEGLGDYDLSGGQVDITGTTTISTGGTLTISGGIYETGSLDNSGTVNLSSGQLSVTATLTMSGNFNMTGGTLEVNSIAGNLEFSDGILNAVEVNGDLTQNGGAVHIGSSPGNTDVTGAYNLNSGTLEIELGGTTPATEYDTLTVTGMATLAGELEVSLIDTGNGVFAPTWGQTFEFLTASNVVGTFTSENLPALADNLYLDIEYGSTGVSLVVLGKGDFNNDGRIDLADYTLWRNNLGATGLDPFSPGDGNGDGTIDMADYDFWKSQFGLDFAALPVGSNQVPEPSSLLVLCFFLLLGLALHKTYRGHSDTFLK